MARDDNGDETERYRQAAQQAETPVPTQTTSET
jgi:hypothetical protein